MKKAISQILSITIVVALILVIFAGYSGYVAGIVNRQKVTQSVSPNVTITKVIIEQQIGTVRGCTGVVTLTNSTTFILPNSVNESQFYATVTTQISYTKSMTTMSDTQAYATVINGTTIQTATCV